MLKTKVVYHQQRPLLVSKNSPDPMDGNNKKGKRHSFIHNLFPVFSNFSASATQLKSNI